MIEYSLTSYIAYTLDQTCIESKICQLIKNELLLWCMSSLINYRLTGSLLSNFLVLLIEWKVRNQTQIISPIVKIFCEPYSSKCVVSNVVYCRNTRSKTRAANSALDFTVNGIFKLVRHEAFLPSQSEIATMMSPSAMAALPAGSILCSRTPPEDNVIILRNWRHEKIWAVGLWRLPRLLEILIMDQFCRSTPCNCIIVIFPEREIKNFLDWYHRA